MTPSDRGGRPRHRRQWASRLDSPWATGLVTLAGASAFVLLRLALAAKGRISHFVLAAPPYSHAGRVPRALELIHGIGYDGQFYFRLALDPADLHHTAYGITLDAPFRLERIAYPALSWLLALGRPGAVVWSLVAVNVLSLTALGAMAGVLARRSGRHALWGLLLVGFSGFVFSLGRDLTEPLAAAAMVGGLLASRQRRPVLAGAAFTVGVLSRETVLVAAGALGVVRLVEMARGRARPGRADAAWALPLVAFAGWQLVCWAETSTVPFASNLRDNSGALLRPLLHALSSSLGQLSPHHAAVDIWLVELAVLALFVAAALWSVRASEAPPHERLALVLYALGMCTYSAYVWGDHNDLRTLVEPYLFAVVVLLGTRRRLGVLAVVLLVPLALGAGHRVLSL
ncbi:MAG: hypothetical protein KGJ77_02350 [Acidobacteriota bacterium]|nr:hypothetical protein [Acidobacteriota bacterium]